MSDLKKMNMRSEEFDWDVPVESVPLPSRGLIYSKNSWFHGRETVDIKAMTAREEDILSSQAYIKKGVVVEELIKSCIMQPNVDPLELTAGDRMALAVAIRITGYGADYAVNITCPACDHKGQTNFDLSELEIKRLGANPVETGKNIFEFLLPVTKKTVHFKILSGTEEAEKNKEYENRVSLMGENSTGIITSNLTHAIVSIDGVSDPAKIAKFVNVMPAFDSRKLREYMSKIQPGIDLNVSYSCSNCEEVSPISLPMSTEFFWPTT